MTCEDCEAIKARVMCDTCSLAEKRCCMCDGPAKRIINLDKYIANFYCDECLPYEVIDGQIFWKVL